MRGCDLGNSITLLASTATQKRVMLFGTKHQQTSAEFPEASLSANDAILIASDVSVTKALTSLNLASGGLGSAGIGPEGARAMSEALKVNIVLIAVGTGLQAGKVCYLNLEPFNCSIFFLIRSFSSYQS